MVSFGQEPADGCILVALIIPLNSTVLGGTDLVMSLDGTTGPPASDAERSGEETADTATTARTGALLDAVRSVVQQEVRAALAQPVGSERVPANSSADSDPGSLGYHPPAAAALSSGLTASSQSVPLGTLPPASALSGIALFDQPSASASQAVNAMQSFATLPALVKALGASPTASSVKPGSAMVLSSALPPITAKLVTKITSGQFVAMKELLADNMSLCHQLESFPTHQHLFSGVTKPRLREIDSPLAWVSCFLAYAAVNH